MLRALLEALMFPLSFQIVKEPIPFVLSTVNCMKHILKQGDAN